MGGRRKEKKQRTRCIIAHWAARFLAVLASVAALSLSAYALNGAVDDNTYALQVTTGAVSADENLAEEVQYFKIIYEDVDGHIRSHRIFPGEGELRDSMDWAVEQGAAGADAAQADTAEALSAARGAFAKQLGYSISRDDTPFQPYYTDTYFFQPLKKVKGIQKVEILTRDTGTWSCQALRVYQVNAVNGVGMYGYVSSQQYADFEGTLIAKMEKGVSFSWPVDRMHRIVPDGRGDAVLTAAEETYSTAST